MLPCKSFLIFRHFSRNITRNSFNDIYLRSSSTLTEYSSVSKRCEIQCLKDSNVLSSLVSRIQINESKHPFSLSNPRLQKISPGLPGKIIELPRPCLTSLVLDLPPIRTLVPMEPPPLPSREAPGVGNEEKQAARLIVIRRRKMKKHKLQKLRKKMKFEWAKVRQKREMRKEKAFQAVLLAQIREAEKFDAEAYVAEKLRKAKEVPLPRTWKGRRLPEFLIKQKLGIK